MTEEDDFDLPDPPALTEDFEPTEITNNSELLQESLAPIDIQINPEKITKEDLAHLTLNKLDEAILVSELSDCNLYLKNIHKNFKFVRSTNSLLKTVFAGLQVHKHRRAVLKEIKESKKDPFELDEYGNPK